jgi:HEAT repeat protein
VEGIRFFILKHCTISMPKDNEDPNYLARFNYFLRMLEEEDPSRRWKAAEMLARLGDERAVDPLILALSDEDWRVRQKAAWALGQIGDQRAIVPLRRALLNEREGVKEIINEALDRIKGFNRQPS